MADDKPNCKVILANNIAKGLLDEVRDGLAKIERKHNQPQEGCPTRNVWKTT
jgi:hypothetical protein